jgi:hypothetical protein
MEPAKANEGSGKSDSGDSVQTEYHEEVSHIKDFSEAVLLDRPRIPRRGRITWIEAMISVIAKSPFNISNGV